MKYCIFSNWFLLLNGVGVSTAEGGAERIEKEKGKKKKGRRGGGKSKARIGEIEDQKTGKKVHV